MTSNRITVLEIMKFSHVTLRQRFALALQACTRAIQRTRVDLLRHTFLVTICVTSWLMKFLVHPESRLQSPDVPPPPSERLARETSFYPRYIVVLLNLGIDEI